MFNYIKQYDDRMKKLFMILMSAALFVCCSDDKEDTGGVVGNQEISLSTEALVLDMNGKTSGGSSNTVTITSSAEWRLAGDVSWCTPSVAKGNNGTTVTFTAATNETGENREVNLYFICGNAARKLTIKQFPEEVVEFKNIGDSYTMAAAGGRMTIMVKTNLDTSTSETSEDWINLYRIGDPSSSEQWIQFVVDANSTFYDREATITMFKGTTLEKKIKVIQSKFIGVIIEGPKSYEFGVDGGTVSVKATGSIDFKSILAANSAWIKAVETSSTGTDIITKTFDITCEAGKWTRTGAVGFVALSGSTTAVTISISQVDPNPELFTIPDATFAKRLVALKHITEKDNKYYMNYSGYIATSLSITGNTYSSIQSLEGLERFVNLTSFTNEDNLVRKVDVSKNTKIRSLSLNYFPLEELIMGDINVTSFTANNYLYAYYDNTKRSKSFTVSSSKLKTITINHTSNATNDEVEWVDITECPALTSLSCNRNSGKLKSIYVTQAQKDAYDAGKLSIITNVNFDKSTGVIVK